MLSSVALPTLLSDVQERLNDLAANSPGTMNPFDDIYKIVFLLTMRAGGATEIADNRKLLDRTLSLYESIEESTTPYQIIFPWLPSPALFKRFIAGTRLYLILQKIVTERKKTGTRYEDPLQHLIDKGDPMRNIIAVRLFVSTVAPYADHPGLVYLWSSVRRSTEQWDQRLLDALLPRDQSSVAC
jgi:hypothetical protein